MRWQHVAENWGAFQGRILDRWPEADADDLSALDGDRDAFVDYIATLTGQAPADAVEDVRVWLDGEVPADVVMDSTHDEASLERADRYVPEGEDPSDDDRRFGDDALTGDADGGEDPPLDRPLGRTD